MTARRMITSAEEYQRYAAEFNDLRNQRGREGDATGEIEADMRELAAQLRLWEMNGGATTDEK